MANRFLGAIAICGSLLAAAPARAVDLYAQLFPLTGEVRILNKDTSPVPFVFYSITSPSAALTSSSPIWKSITENYDAPVGATPGSGLVDSNGEWIKFPSTATGLFEGALDADGGNIPARRAVSLGNIWNPYATPFPDLVFDFQTDTESIPVTVELALDGDYSANQVVDSADYVLWRHYAGVMMDYAADGDVDGDVDLDDYLVWQHNYGLTLPLPPYVLGGGSGGGIAGGVPEPASAALVLLAAGAIKCFFPRGKRR
jgi:hypothetical protein